MAISSKGDDHSEIESLFGEEISHLSLLGANFYLGTIKKLSM
jgi:hypothetical protein